ncbi:DUF262 domain-containing protein [Neisseria canis]|uniref:Uncharacterized conserved protein n=1 Tax=Neisseria canis TaxID=493 RepID=A0A3S4P3M2_9NEIS|nr:DUF262 domain-containing protein [Neisseria canis]VEF00219.1 Uncharacterized conserved protein [Neisseria canis]
MDQTNLNDCFELENDEQDNSENLYPVENFKLTTTPNDFNISTIISFLDAGIFKIPDFQRNYVWDINKASRLIESLLIGLPIPQMFLYEKARNEFYVIDGQQRLMSIYFFVKGRFPKPQARILLKSNHDEKKFIKESFINEDDYFTNFSLKLDSKNNPNQNKFHNKNYQTLDNEDKITLDLATIRNMVIKPAQESDENVQAMFEIFNRLNSGGMNLNNQEIRMSLYNSIFMRELIELNKNSIWKKLIKKTEADLRLKDVETILRLFGMLLTGYNSLIDKIEYQNSIIGFLNNFANASKKFKQDEIQLLSKIWSKFMEECKSLDSVDFSFSNDLNSKLSITIFESVFYGCCRDAYEQKNLALIKVTKQYVEELKNDHEFKLAATGKTTSKSNVTDRLKRAYEKFQVVSPNRN